MQNHNPAKGRYNFKQSLTVMWNGSKVQALDEKKPH